jgi:hypothetical protein
MTWWSNFLAMLERRDNRGSISRGPTKRDRGHVYHTASGTCGAGAAQRDPFHGPRRGLHDSRRPMGEQPRWRIARSPMNPIILLPPSYRAAVSRAPSRLTPAGPWAVTRVEWTSVLALQRVVGPAGGGGPMRIFYAWSTCTTMESCRWGSLSMAGAQPKQAPSLPPPPPLSAFLPQLAHRCRSVILCAHSGQKGTGQLERRI